MRRRWIPRWVMTRLQRRFRDACGDVVSPHLILDRLGVPPARIAEPWGYFLKGSWDENLGDDNGLPVPPPDLTMGYLRGGLEGYLASGRNAAAMLRDALTGQNVRLPEGTAVMDWGCTSGRVLRWFAEEARRVTFWGVDIDGPSISWAKSHLSPPFKFLQSTIYPHLPFSDDTFSLIYGLSVMTHIEYFADSWVMEIRRVLKSGGLAILTVHDEETIAYLRSTKAPPWLPRELTAEALIAKEVAVVGGDRWSQTYTFFSQAYIRREWGKYIDVVKVQPLAGGGQTAVMMRK